MCKDKTIYPFLKSIWYFLSLKTNILSALNKKLQKQCIIGRYIFMSWIENMNLLFDLMSFVLLTYAITI